MLDVGNMYSKNNYILKYATVARGTDRTEVKSILDIVLIKIYAEICLLCGDIERT